MPEKKKFQSSNKVLVVGGGMGGIRAALDLAETGRDVVLIDKDFAIGGLMTQLDRTFPTNNCDLCTLSPHLSESGRKLHIQLKTMTQLSGLTGEAGHFTATLTTQPRYIDLEKCTGCGECARKFPESVRFTPGLDHRAPTCMRYPQGTPYAYSIIKDERTDFDGLARHLPGRGDPARRRRKSAGNRDRGHHPGPRGGRLQSPGPGHVRLWRQPERRHQPGIRTDSIRLRADQGGARAPLRRQEAQQDRLDSVRRVPGYSGGLGLLLLQRLLHVRPQGSHGHPGALL